MRNKVSLLVAPASIVGQGLIGVTAYRSTWSSRAGEYLLVMKAGDGNRRRAISSAGNFDTTYDSVLNDEDDILSGWSRRREVVEGIPYAVYARFARILGVVVTPPPQLPSGGQVPQQYPGFTPSPAPPSYYASYVPNSSFTPSSFPTSSVPQFEDSDPFLGDLESFEIPFEQAEFEDDFFFDEPSFDEGFVYDDDVFVTEEYESAFNEPLFDDFDFDDSVDDLFGFEPEFDFDDDFSDFDEEVEFDSDFDLAFGEDLDFDF